MRRVAMTDDASNDGPWRILVTRAARQSSRLAERLRALGAEPVVIPVMEIAVPASFVALDTAIERLADPADAGGFHWLLFTSANAVEMLAERVRLVAPWMAGAGRFELPRGCKVAAIGAATAGALVHVGLRANLVPPEAVAESLAEALRAEVRQPDGSATRFLLVRAETARELLPDALRLAGGDVTVAASYRNLIPEGSARSIREMFARSESWPDAIAFTSSSSVRNLLSLCKAAGVQLSDTALRISIGPITSQTLADAGLKAHAEAPEASVEALAETVVKTLRRPGER